MKIAVSFLLLAVLAAGSFTDLPVDSADTSIPVFRINLNDEPKQRFKAVIAHFAPEVTDILNKYLPYFPAPIVKMFKYLDFTI